MPAKPQAPEELRSRRLEGRSWRRKMTRTGRKLAQRDAVALCGVRLAWGQGTSTTARLVVYPDGGAAFAGVLRCGSVWECPECAERISYARGEECQRVVQTHLAGGGGAYLVTLTLPHDAGDSLAHLRRAVARGWQYVCSGAPWLRLKARCGIVGSVRALECTVGPHGWHPHLHVVLFTERWLSDAAAGELRRLIAQRWARKMEREGYRQPHVEHGVTLQRGDRAGFYVAKLGLAREVTGGPAKVGRGPNRTPWQILEDLTLQSLTHKAPRDADLELWREWCREMRGARQLTWSLGMRERYLDGPERGDQEISNSESQEPVELLRLSERDWYRMQNTAGLPERVLDKAEELAARREVGESARRALGLLIEAGIGRRLELNSPSRAAPARGPLSRPRSARPDHAPSSSAPRNP